MISSILNEMFCSMQAYLALTFISSLDINCPIGMAIIYYCMKLKRTPYFIMRILSEKTIFLYNYIKLRIQDETPIKEIFENNRDVSVLVTDTDNLIGG